MSAIPVIEISGNDARERGRSYGEQARPQIARSIEYYQQSFRRSTGLDWEQILQFVPAWDELVEGYLPGITEEVRGIAEGSGYRLEEIQALNGRGELVRPEVFASLMPDRPAGADKPGQDRADSDKAEDGCSSFAMLAESNSLSHVFAGQNWDWRHGVADTVVILRIVQPDKPTIICQVEAGQVGRHGVNSAGLALNANGLGGVFATGLGVPGTYVRRKILESWNMHDALQAIFRVTQAYNTNLLLTHRDNFAIDIEATSGRHGWMYPTDGVLVHANHFQSFIPPQIENDYKPFSIDSLYRVPRIDKGLRAAGSASGVAAFRQEVRSTMADHFGAPNSVCNHPDPSRHPADRYSTVVSSLVDLTTGDYAYTAGLPCENDYQLLPWNAYDGPDAPAGELVATAASTAPAEQCS
ncbi:C45 family autoproteolytic acyltransferase/hydolase [Nakamurella lactea]|uniref:C45 family autoproteolytic acyltransferase/hydolase n=1 Tax=Nakamurella lactea TaxID=459515 RepID=UPI000424F35E|nr:C45 family peptidase [Nakamurella lactea]